MKSTVGGLAPQKNKLYLLATDSTGNPSYTAFGGIVGDTPVVVIRRKTTTGEVALYDYYTGDPGQDFLTNWNGRSSLDYTVNAPVGAFAIPEDSGAASGGGVMSVNVSNFPSNYPDTVAISLLGESLNAQDYIGTLLEDANNSLVSVNAGVGSDGVAPSVPDSDDNGSGLRKWGRWIYDRLTSVGNAVGSLVVGLGTTGTDEPGSIPDNAANGTGIRKIQWMLYKWITNNTYSTVSITASADPASGVRAIVDGIVQAATLSHTATTNSIFGTVDARAFNSAILVCTSTTATGNMLIEHSADGTNWNTVGVYYSSTSGAGAYSKSNGNTPFTAAAGLHFIVPVYQRYIRLRASTVGTNTSIWAIKFQQNSSIALQMDYNRVDAPLPPTAIASSGILPAAGTKIASAASTNATYIGPGNYTILFIDLYNTGGTAAYFKIYNKAGSPTVGTDTPVLIFAIPPNQKLIAPLPPAGVRAGTTGLAWAITGGAADTDTTAVTLNQIVGTILYT